MLSGLMTAGVALMLGLAVGLMPSYRIVTAIVVGLPIASYTLLVGPPVAQCESIGFAD